MTLLLCTTVVQGDEGANSSSEQTETPHGAEDGGPASADMASPVATRIWRSHRTTRQPDLRTATARYEPTFVLSPEGQAIIKALDQPLPAEGLRLPDGATLEDFRVWIAATYGIPTQIDHRKLKEELNINPEQPVVAKHGSACSLWTALKLVLDELEMTVNVRNDVLVLTPQLSAEQELVTAVYSMPLPYVVAGNPNPVIDIIQRFAAASSWDTVGGPGWCRWEETKGVMIVGQTLAVHRDVGTLMRSFYDAGFTNGPGPVPEGTPLQIHRMNDPSLSAAIMATVVPVCNAALGTAGDSRAKLTLIGNDRIVVQSESRSFHSYAAGFIHSMNGDEQPGRVGSLQPQPDARRATNGYRPIYAVSPLEATVIAALEKPLPKAGIHLDDDATLEDLQAAVAKTYGIPVRIDWQALEDAGHEPPMEIGAVHLTNGTLWTALKNVLSAIDIEPTVRDEALILTTPEGAEDVQITAAYPFSPRISNANSVAELIQSCVAAETWPVGGGQSSIRIMDQERMLVLEQTLEVHMFIKEFLRTVFDTGWSEGDNLTPGHPMVNVHRLVDTSIAKDLVANLVPLCNATLGVMGDPDATVTIIGGDRLIVRSISKPFLAYVAELIHSLDGLEDDMTEAERESLKNNGFCWVAREVYGPSNPRWLRFRNWLRTDAPRWFRDAYIAYGQDAAAWIRDRPIAKAIVRQFMNAAIDAR